MAVGRDSKGHYLPGQSGNMRGRPPRATEQEYFEALKDVVPIERFKRMVEKQAERAEKGNIISFNAIISRLVPERRDLTVEHSGGLNIMGLDEMLEKVYGNGSPGPEGEQPPEPGKTS